MGIIFFKKELKDITNYNMEVKNGSKQQIKMILLKIKTSGTSKQSKHGWPSGLRRWT